MVVSVYNELCHERAKLSAVKEKILSCYLGLGWDDAHHPWSKDGVPFTSQLLLKHLVDNILPMERELEIPPEPPIKFSSPLEIFNLRAKCEFLFLVHMERKKIL